MSESELTKPIISLSPKTKKIDLDDWGTTETQRVPEMIILYGNMGSGKTYKYCSLIQAAHRIDKSTRGFVVSTEKGIFRNILEFPYLEVNEVVRMMSCQNIDEVMARCSELLGSGQLRMSDWVVIDLASTVWDQFPDLYARKVLKKGDTNTPGSGSETMIMEYIKDGGVGNVFFEHYQTGINPFWHRWDTKLRESGANVILVCGETALTEEEVRGHKKKDSKETITMYKDAGQLPSVQKKTSFQYHTVIHCSRPYIGRGRFVRTVKDQGRDPIGGGGEIELKVLEKTTTFGEYYLREIGSWV